MKDLQKLVWLDLEMTGLDPAVDVILEIAAVVTTADLEVIAELPALIIHQPREKLEQMIPLVRDMHTHSGLLNDVSSSTTTLDEAQETVLSFLKKHVQPGVSPLCGNSVWQDRRFLHAYMPQLHNFFHYRNVDVSTIKELVKYWYGVKYQKPDVHRALPDIHASIQELVYYRKTFFLS